MGMLRSLIVWIRLLQLLVPTQVPMIVANPIEARDTSAPKPIVIPASQNFEGSDGAFSTFTLQIGTPAQVVNVFISTAGYQTWAVAPQGCNASDPTVPANCDQLRGGIFNPNQSSTWNANSLPQTSSGNKTGGFTLGLEQNFGYQDVGLYGFDTVALGWQGSGGPSLDGQIVASIATNNFFLGTFGMGLCPRILVMPYIDLVQALVPDQPTSAALPTLRQAICRV